MEDREREDAIADRCFFFPFPSSVGAVIGAASKSTNPAWTVGDETEVMEAPERDDAIADRSFSFSSSNGSKLEHWRDFSRLWIDLHCVPGHHSHVRPLSSSLPFAKLTPRFSLCSTAGPASPSSSPNPLTSFDVMGLALRSSDSLHGRPSLRVSSSCSRAILG